MHPAGTRDGENVAKKSCTLLSTAWNSRLLGAVGVVGSACALSLRRRFSSLRLLTPFEARGFGSLPV